MLFVPLPQSCDATTRPTFMMLIKYSYN
jgi:hypothetical protein